MENEINQLKEKEKTVEIFEEMRQQIDITMQKFDK